MKGKKYKLMYCGCCTCVDMRDKELEKEHKKEMKNWSAVRFRKATPISKEILWIPKLY